MTNNDVGKLQSLTRVLVTERKRNCGLDLIATPLDVVFACVVEGSRSIEVDDVFRRALACSSTTRPHTRSTRSARAR